MGAQKPVSAWVDSCSVTAHAEFLTSPIDTSETRHSSLWHRAPRKNRESQTLLNLTVTYWASLKQNGFSECCDFPSIKKLFHTYSRVHVQHKEHTTPSKLREHCNTAGGCCQHCLGADLEVTEDIFKRNHGVRSENEKSERWSWAAHFLHAYQQRLCLRRTGLGAPHGAGRDAPQLRSPPPSTRAPEKRFQDHPALLAPPRSPGPTPRSRRGCPRPGGHLGRGRRRPHGPGASHPHRGPAPAASRRAGPGGRGASDPAGPHKARRLRGDPGSGGGAAGPCGSPGSDAPLRSPARRSPLPGPRRQWSPHRRPTPRFLPAARPLPDLPPLSRGRSRAGRGAIGPGARGRGPEAPAPRRHRAVGGGRRGGESRSALPCPAPSRCRNGATHLPGRPPQGKPEVAAAAATRPGPKELKGRAGRVRPIH